MVILPMRKMESTGNCHVLKLGTDPTEYCQLKDLMRVLLSCIFLKTKPLGSDAGET